MVAARPSANARKKSEGLKNAIVEFDAHSEKEVVQRLLSLG